MLMLLSTYWLYIRSSSLKPTLSHSSSVSEIGSAELTNEDSYKASISSVRLKLQKLQETYPKAQKLKKQLEDYKEIDKVFHHQGLPFVPKSTRTKITSHYYNNLLVNYFTIKKTYKLVARKYYYSMLAQDVETYVKCYNMCLALKVVRHKLYNVLQFLPILTHC